jgi:SAM-dependent methyltransferase
LNLTRIVRYAAFAVMDAVQPKQPLIPPRRLSFVYGGGDAAAIGQEFKNYFIQQAGMKPTDSVLDIGCGIGRMAVPLTEYLSQGRYEGFDTMPRGISWCRDNITGQFPNFRFQHTDIYNKSYNPSGKIQPADFRFPYDAGQFDFAFAVSVFTHMFPSDISRYLREAARVLKPGGVSLFSWFILNQDSMRLLEEGRSFIPMAHEVSEGCRAKSARVPEKSIGIPESKVRSMYTQNGFQIAEPIRFGVWCGRPQGLSFQDIVIAVR